MTVHEKFKSKIMIDETTGCWNWNACIDTSGYATFIVDGKKVRGHRYSYQYYIGDIGTLFVCHKCDNTKCVNPFHLFSGTHQDNMDDMYNKGRRKRGTCPSLTAYYQGCRCDGCKAFAVAHNAKYYALQKEKKLQLRLLK